MSYWYDLVVSSLLFVYCWLASYITMIFKLRHTVPYIASSRVFALNCFLSYYFDTLQVCYPSK